MKTLKQLGISPAPWNVDDEEWGCDNEIWCEYISDIIVKGEKRTKVIAKCNAHFDTYKPDARLIAAAPELYETLYKITKEQECGQDCTECTNHGCVIKECKAALAKAAGESEVAK